MNTGIKEAGVGELCLPVELYEKRPESYIYDECDSNLVSAYVYNSTIHVIICPILHELTCTMHVCKRL